MDQSQLILYRLDRIERWIISVYLKEFDVMALGQDILDAVTAESTAVDSFIALVNGLVANNTIPADVAAKILDEVSASKAKLDAAITANTPPPTP